jgi:lysozyme
MDVVELLKRHEGFSRTVYLCTAGRQTIGYGRNLSDVGISEAEADWLLRRDLDKAARQLEAEGYWAGLGEVRRAVLLDMVVNLGWGGFARFHKLRAALAAREYARAATEMLDSDWHRQLPGRSTRLAAMMRTAEWPALWAGL